MRKHLTKILTALAILAIGIGLIFIMRAYVIPNSQKPDIEASNTKPNINDEANTPSIEDSNDSTLESSSDKILFNINIVITDINGRKLSDDIIGCKSKSLLEVLRANYEIRFESEGIGTFIYDLGPLKTDKWHTYIAIYVNDEYSSYGVDSIYLYEGLKIEFKETRV